MVNLLVVSKSDCTIPTSNQPVCKQTSAISQHKGSLYERPKQALGNSIWLSSPCLGERG